MSIHRVYVTTLMAASIAASPGVAKADSGMLADSIGVIDVHPQVQSPVLRAQVSSDAQPVVGLNYYLTSHVAVATQIAFPRHEISVGGVSQGSVSLAPFNRLLQYHFMPARKFSPYLGAGINHTIFFDQSGLLPGFDHFGPSTGAVLQSGFNYRPGRKYFVNIDVAKWYSKTDLTPQRSATIETTKLNPVTVGVSLGRYPGSTL